MFEAIERFATLAAWALLFGNILLLAGAALAEFSPSLMFTSYLRSLHRLFTTPARAACLDEQRETERGNGRCL